VEEQEEAGKEKVTSGEEKKGAVNMDSGSGMLGGKGYSKRSEPSKGVPRSSVGECSDRSLRLRRGFNGVLV